MINFSIAMSLFMLTHYGCAILKHSPKESDSFLKQSLIFKLIFTVLIFRASVIENYYDMLVGWMGFGAICVSLSFYLWLHGVTFVKTGKTINQISFKDIVDMFKKKYEIYKNR